MTSFISGLWPALTHRLMTRRLAVSAITVVAASLFLLPVRDSLGVLNLLLLFLLVSLGLGLTLGAGPAAFGAILSFFAFDYFFLPPFHTLTTDRDHALGLFVFLGVALVSSTLVARIQARTLEAQRESRRTQLLYDLQRALLRGAMLDDLLRTITDAVVAIYGARACRLVTRGVDQDLKVRAESPLQESQMVDRRKASMVQWVIDHREPAGFTGDDRMIMHPHGTANRLGRRFSRPREAVLYVPILTPGDVLGVIEVTGRPGGGRFQNEDERILSSFADQAALALERARLIDESTRSLILERSDELKSALLAAVSHDLRTPLTAIKASSSAMLDRSIEWSDEDRFALLETIDEETDRLTQMVSNLLDLSRIEGGVLHPDRDWHDVRELVDDAVDRTKRQFPQHRFEIKADPGIQLVSLDWSQMSQVLMNLLSNACKYSSPGSDVHVFVRREDQTLEIRVRDQGIGTSSRDSERIFERFYRVDSSGPVSGSGIGLSICKGLVEAHGGTIRAESAIGAGTTIIVKLPMNGTRT